METVIFTDGASKGNPGRGGWGAIVVSDGFAYELGGGELNVSNNKMELQSAIQALTFARTKALSNITVYSDSRYVINGITKWIFGWKKNGWKTKTGEPVVNAEMWKDLHALQENLKAKWNYTGGHIEIVGNERVDRIASNFAEGKNVELYSGTLSDYGLDILNLSYSEAAKTAKSDARSRSKLKAYSYISEVEGVVQIHKTWSECESRVKGRTARFKKAISKEEEKEIIKDFSL